MLMLPFKGNKCFIAIKINVKILFYFQMDPHQAKLKRKRIQPVNRKSVITKIREK